MLGKLLKHEFRATGRIMGPLYLVLLLLAAGANPSVRVLESSASGWLQVLSGLILVAFGIAVAGVCVMSVVLMVNRFRSNLLSDEGYGRKSLFPRFGLRPPLSR
jgi:cytochrome c biogenesis protein CcdA